MYKLNEDFITRDNIIFGSYQPNKYIGGIRRFTADADTIRKLFERGFIDPEGRQNESPSAAELFAYSVISKSKCRFTGYAVSHDREDYRVSIDGIESTVSSPYIMAEEITKFTQAFQETADEFNIFNHENSGGVLLRAWWD